MKLTALLSLRRCTAPAAVALFGIGVTTPSNLAAQDLLAIKAGRLITVSGKDIENAVVLCENGRITAVGTDVEVPWNATVIDATDKVVAPTWIVAHSTGGMGRGGNNERMQNVPFLSIADGIDPSATYFEDARRNGVGSLQILPGNSTLLGGVGMVVRPIGAVVEDMTVRDRSGLKMSLGSGGQNRVAQIRSLRRALEDADTVRADFERRKKEFEAEQAAGAIDKDKKFEEKPDDAKQVVIDLIEGKIRGYLYVPGAAEIAEVARMKQKWGSLDLVLVLGARTYKAARQIAALEIPVILDSSALEFYETDPVTEEETLVSPAKVFTDQGIEFATTLAPSTNSSERYPWWQLATLVRNGMPRRAALRSLTIVPATILGLDEETGTLEVGKIANLQVLTGDPFAATSWVDTVILEGNVIYERDQDRRLQHLFGEGEKN